VRLEAGQAKVIYDDAKQTPQKLAEAVDKLGFQASVLSVTDAPRPTLYVEGITDRAAARKVEKALKALKGVTGVTVDPGAEVYVQYDPRWCSPRIWWQLWREPASGLASAHGDEPSPAICRTRRPPSGDAGQDGHRSEGRSSRCPYACGAGAARRRPALTGRVSSRWRCP
jgi:copper chaperone CopZ